MTPLDAITAWASPLRTHAWAYPALEVIHLFGITLVIGNLMLFELRVWGLGKALPINDLARLSLTLAICGFTIAAMTGLTMFVAQAADLISNRAFLLKMVLLFFAGTNAAIFHARGSLNKLDAIAKLQTLLSLFVWIAVMAMGRAIAYL
jgi:hypothetical protein